MASQLAARSPQRKLDQYMPRRLQPFMSQLQQLRHASRGARACPPHADAHHRLRHHCCARATSTHTADITKP